MTYRNPDLVSIVTPCFNEELSIEECLTRVKLVMATTGYDYEHVIIDNCSTDKTFELLSAIARTDKRVKVLRNSKNVGPFVNIWIGLENCKGDVVIPLMPADLQDPPELIPELIQYWCNGFDVVQGVATDRDEKRVLKLIRRTFYSIVAFLAIEPLPRGANEFSAIDQKVLKKVLETKDRKPYVRGLIHLTSRNSIQVSYFKKSRGKGKSKESLLTYIDHAFNAIVATSTLLPRFIVAGGLVLSFLSIVFLVISMLFSWDQQNYFQLIIIGLMGFNFILTGFLSEYLISIHRQVRPIPNSYFLHKINTD